MTGAHGRNDAYAWGDSFMARIDPRIKIAAAAALLAVNLTSRTALVCGIIAAAMFALMITGRLPYRRQLLAIAFPVSFAVFAVLSQALFYGDSVLLRIGPFDVHSDGIAHGLFIALRIVAGGLVVVLLGVTTPVNRLSQALRWFRIPATFVELLQLTYRYLQDTYAEFARMRQAQRARLGWTSTRNGLASSRMLGGALFVRVLERGGRSAEAMRCRGAGPVTGTALPAPGREDLAAALLTTVFLGVMISLSYFEVRL